MIPPGRLVLQQAEKPTEKRHTDKMGRPRIALPEIDQDVRNYTRALYAAGMEPVLISVQREQVKQNYQQDYLDFSQFRGENYDGLLIPGGGDINPACYGQQNRGSVWIRDCLDRLQLDVLDAFVRREKPVLGICRGHQLINVYFGGSLDQDIAVKASHSRNPDGRDNVHQEQVRPQCWLSGIYGKCFAHNSCHHQAVATLGNGLVIDGICPEDGTVEAMHHEELPVYGVQWHPERMCLEHARKDTVCGLPLFAFFCRLCGGDPQDIALNLQGEDVQEMMGL